MRAFCNRQRGVVKVVATTLAMLLILNSIAWANPKFNPTTNTNLQVPNFLQNPSVEQLIETAVVLSFKSFLIPDKPQEIHVYPHIKDTCVDLYFDKKYREENNWVIPCRVGTVIKKAIVGLNGEFIGVRDCRVPESPPEISAAEKVSKTKLSIFKNPPGITKVEVITGLSLIVVLSLVATTYIAELLRVYSIAVSFFELAAPITAIVSIVVAASFMIISRIYECGGSYCTKKQAIADPGLEDKMGQGRVRGLSPKAEHVEQIEVNNKKKIPLKTSYGELNVGNPLSHVWYGLITRTEV